MTGLTLVTGGAGFIGTNLVARLAASGRRVLVYDNLSRPGVEKNLAWLRAAYGDRIECERADIRDGERLRAAVCRAARIYHFAAQVAVTTSLANPVEDFSVNALGTLTLLEAIRNTAHLPPVLFTSTNKVYGALENVGLHPDTLRYLAAVPHDKGIDEGRALDFHSPYGCSKGTADQYVLDYARSYGLRATVFRMSCIYGPHQFGTEDQGWVAHFLIRAMEGKPITLYGDGRQVRDILFVEDLVDALLAAERHPELSGRAFNIGGGPGNAISLLELIELIGDLAGGTPRLEWGGWRIGDQRFYVSDHGAFTRATGWRPRIPIGQGLERLWAWLAANRTPLRARRAIAERVAAR
ncbi:MAG: NAD-dependent epimerase/dehydratase family protein [Rhodospirillales bacterium]|nr:NAD-dependent epimerase/dehydratase family protein [Rhodospirillales bacterium]